MIKVFLIERQKIVREGIKVLLEEEADFKVFVSENKDVKIPLINRLNPDLILISLDNLDEADFSYLNIFLDLNKNRDRLAYGNSFKIIVYAEKVNEFILNKIIEIGCQGYLLKGSSIEELKQAIRSVYKGYKHIGNSVFEQIKQISMVNSTLTFTEDKTIYDEDYNTGLISVKSPELDFADIKINFTPSVTPLESNFVGNSNTHSLPQPKSKWRELGWIILLVSLGCITGITGAISLLYRPVRSFEPIAKYGTISSDLVDIASPLAGKKIDLNYRVGDLVKANEVVAKIKPLPPQEQNVSTINQQIDELQNTLEIEEKLLSDYQLKLQQGQKQLRQLFTAKNQSRQINKQTQGFRASSKELYKNADIALNNYQKLQKLYQQNIVSQLEVTNAKQAWLAARANAKNENSLSQSSSTKTDISDRLGLARLQNNISRWQTDVNKQESKIEQIQQKINSQQKSLATIKASSTAKVIDLQAPFTGIVHQIPKSDNEAIAKNDVAIQLSSCQKFWVEVTLDGNNLHQIDFQQPAIFHLENYRHKLTGKIISIEYLAENNESSPFFSTYKTSVSHLYLEENAIAPEMKFKIIIDFPFLENYMQQREFCGIGDKVLITFNQKLF